MSEKEEESGGEREKIELLGTVLRVCPMPHSGSNWRPMSDARLTMEDIDWR
ncbi:MAG: hypothetical protein WBH57_05865 [Anaerolineae bacterium]